MKKVFFDAIICLLFTGHIFASGAQESKGSAEGVPII